MKPAGIAADVKYPSAVRQQNLAVADSDYAHRYGPDLRAGKCLSKQFRRPGVCQNTAVPAVIIPYDLHRPDKRIPISSAGSPSRNTVSPRETSIVRARDNPACRRAPSLPFLQKRAPHQHIIIFLHSRLPFSIQTANDVGALIQPQLSAVQRDMILWDCPPLHIGVKAIVRSAALIFCSSDAAPALPCALRTR